MLYIPVIDDYLKILTNEEVKDFEAINFCEYFKSTREKLFSKLNIEKKNHRKIVKSIYIFLTTPDEVEKYTKMMQSNSSDNYVYRYNIEILDLFDLEF